MKSGLGAISSAGYPVPGSGFQPTSLGTSNLYLYPPDIALLVPFARRFPAFFFAIPCPLSSKHARRGPGHRLSRPGHRPIPDGCFSKPLRTPELVQNFRFSRASTVRSATIFLATLNVEFLSHVSIGRTSSLYPGSGPCAVVFLEQTTTPSTHRGTFFTFGFAHRERVLPVSEVGASSRPHLKFGVGCSVRKRNP